MAHDCGMASEKKVVGVTDKRWRDPVTGERWNIGVVWAQLGGIRYEPIEITLRSASYGTGPDGVSPLLSDVFPAWPRQGQPRGMTADDIRRLPLGTLLADMRAENAARWATIAEDEGDEDAAVAAREWVGRIPLPEVAQVYRDALRERGNPTQAVARRFAREGEDELPRSTAARWVREARRAGFLPTAKQGVAG